MQEQLPRLLSFLLQLRFLLASYPELMAKVLGIIQRVISSHVIRIAGYTRASRCTPGYLLMLIGKLDRPSGAPLCRYVSRPALSEKRLALTPNGNVSFGRLLPEIVPI